MKKISVSSTPELVENHDRRSIDRCGQPMGWLSPGSSIAHLLAEVGREEVGEGLLLVVHAGGEAGGAVLHRGQVVDLVRVVQPRVGPRRGVGGHRHLRLGCLISSGRLPLMLILEISRSRTMRYDR